MANKLRTGDIVRFDYATKWKWGVTPNPIGYSGSSTWSSYRKDKYFVGENEEDAIRHYKEKNLIFFKEKYTADAHFKDNIKNTTPNWKRILG